MQEYDVSASYVLLIQFGQTPLECAIEQEKKIEVVKFFVDEAKIDLTKFDEVNSALVCESTIIKFVLYTRNILKF